jgi:hypothetical protein
LRETSPTARNGRSTVLRQTITLFKDRINAVASNGIPHKVSLGIEEILNAEGPLYVRLELLVSVPGRV